MTPMNIQPGLSPLPLSKPDSHPVAEARSNFSTIIQSTIDQTIKAEEQSNKAIEQLQSGEARNLHEVMIAVEEADISLKMMVGFRNKALQAYDEIMRIQI